jgi:hypothetical protein
MKSATMNDEQKTTDLQFSVAAFILPPFIHPSSFIPYLSSFIPHPFLSFLIP